MTLTRLKTKGQDMPSTVDNTEMQKAIEQILKVKGGPSGEQ